MQIKLSLIIPTIGRPLLKRLISQVVAQLDSLDEVIVVGDGPSPEASEQLRGLDSRIHYHEHGPTRCWGHEQRNWAMTIATGTHLMFLDDDDELLPGALGVIRATARKYQDKILIFRMHHGRSVLWIAPRIYLGNVGTQMFVVPNVPGRLGTWGSRYEGDLDFLKSTVSAYPNKENDVIWREEITAIHGYPQL